MDTLSEERVHRVVAAAQDAALRLRLRQFSSWLLARSFAQWTSVARIMHENKLVSRQALTGFMHGQMFTGYFMLWRVAAAILNTEAALISKGVAGFRHNILGTAKRTLAGNAKEANIKKSMVFRTLSHIVHRQTTMGWRSWSAECARIAEQEMLVGRGARRFLNGCVGGGFRALRVYADELQAQKDASRHAVAHVVSLELAMVWVQWGYVNGVCNEQTVLVHRGAMRFIHRNKRAGVNRWQEEANKQVEQIKIISQALATWSARRLTRAWAQWMQLKLITVEKSLRKLAAEKTAAEETSAVKTAAIKMVAKAAAGSEQAVAEEVMAVTSLATGRVAKETVAEEKVIEETAAEGAVAVEAAAEETAPVAEEGATEEAAACTLPSQVWYHIHS